MLSAACSSDVGALSAPAFPKVTQIENLPPAFLFAPSYLLPAFPVTDVGVLSALSAFPVIRCTYELLLLSTIRR
jgi:hypothetical protein